MELLSNLFVVCMMIMLFVSLSKENKVEPVIETPKAETNIKYLSDLTFKEIVDLLGEDYIWGMCEEKVVDMSEYKERFRRKVQEQLNEEEHMIYVPTGEEDDSLFSFNPNMHRRRQAKYDKVKEKALRPKIQRFGSIVFA